jgi:ferritin-like metal-binding protein YciE
VGKSRKAVTAVRCDLIGMDKRAEIIDWLNDAYAMERALEITLEKQAKSGEVHRAIRERAAIHLDETRAHAERVQRCLEILGSTPSTVKSTASQVLETGKKYMTMFARDERVKDYLAATGAEYFEVACYKALIAAAGLAGEERIVEALTKNMREDAAMAQWLDENIDAVIRDYLSEGPQKSAAA